LSQSAQVLGEDWPNCRRPCIGLIFGAASLDVAASRAFGGVMQFGIVLPTRADSWRIAQRAEALGVSHA